MSNQWHALTSKRAAGLGVTPASLSRAASPAAQANRMEIRNILRGPQLQAKLTVGAPDDEYEREADQVADQVMRMPDPGHADPGLTTGMEPRVQRMCDDCEEELDQQ